MTNATAPYFLCKHAGRATNLLARAGICRATDSDRLCLELPAVSDRIGKGRHASMSRRLPGKKLCAYDDEIQV